MKSFLVSSIAVGDPRSFPPPLPNSLTRANSYVTVKSSIVHAEFRTRPTLKSLTPGAHFLPEVYFWAILNVLAFLETTYSLRFLYDILKISCLKYPATSIWTDR